ncbi:anti-sigma factor antagonist [Brevibacillus sp. H7]|jgi:anti-sigma B factor antagonist|uniref:anti-sigma factor antagonist n=1 Tax=Brevibacillus sp. H7 TaxID=3349138 RepID=UPI0038197505
MNVTIRTVSHGGEHTLYVTGEIDAYTGPKLKEQLLSLVGQPDAKSVTVDLQGVEYIDSTGIGIFVGACKTSRKTGCQLNIQNAAPRVERLFQITGLHEIMGSSKGEKV